MPNIKKKIFVNASTVKISGGLIVALSYIETLSQSTNFEIFLACPRIPEYQKLEGCVSEIKYVPDFILKRTFRWLLDYFWLPGEIKKIGPHMILSLGNIPAITSLHQIYLHDNPYLTHGIPKELNLSINKRITHKLRVFFTKKRLKYVNEIWAQTKLEQKLIAEYIKFHGSIKIVTPIIPLHLAERLSKSKKLATKPKNTIRLICLSNYFEHKNIEILFDVINLAASKGFKLQIVFTLDSNSGKKSLKIAREIDCLPNELAFNIGRVNSNNILPIIDQCDGVILPSLMETFGLNCFDAWISNKPYLISDKAYAHGVCGDGAVFFKPTSPSDILDKIIKTYSNTEGIKRLIATGKRKISGWPRSEIVLAQIENTRIG